MAGRCRRSLDEPLLRISGDAARYDHREDNNTYTQPGSLFRLFNDGQRQRFFSNIAVAMQGVPWQRGHFRRADPAWADGVEAALKAVDTEPGSAPTTAADVANAAE